MVYERKRDDVLKHFICKLDYDVIGSREPDKMQVISDKTSKYVNPWRNKTIVVKRGINTSAREKMKLGLDLIILRQKSKTIQKVGEEKSKLLECYCIKGLLPPKQCPVSRI